MKREEERINESKDFRRYRFDRSDNYEGDIEDVFVKGAKWADESMLLKAEEWLRSEMERRFNDESGNFENTICTGSESGNEWIEKFRKAMLN